MFSEGRSPANAAARILMLCRGEAEDIAEEMQSAHGWTSFCLLTIVAGSGCYGATIGLWRSPLQALFTGIKFPLLMLLTTAGNAVLNGMLAQVIGARLTFGESARAVLASFALISVILASLSPVTLFMWFNTPPLEAGEVVLSHNFTLVSHVLIIAFAGITANVRLLWLLRHLGGSRAVARRILAAWLTGNMFLGCQLSWLLRPFIGSPGLPVEFFRSDAFQGNFYESTFRAFMNLVH
jgi:hypothetical protein